MKNHIKAFWHLDRQIKNYEKFKLDEKARATSGLVGRIFFACLKKFLFKFYNPSSMPNIGKNLQKRSEKTFAKIGSFKLTGKDYHVVAFHLFSDQPREKGIDATTYADATHHKFQSLYDGQTFIAILESQQSDSCSCDPFNLYSRFDIRREHANNSRWHHGESSKDPVLNKCHIFSNLTFLDKGAEDVQGSDRLLDQKITQIMLEIFMQNKEIISLRVDSHHDDLPVLIAGGFTLKRAKKIMDKLYTFRSKEGNKLFPSYKDYGSALPIFTREDFTKQNVHYSRGSPEAWSDIIQREPILKPKSAILPEYWAKKPNIVSIDK